VESFCIGSEMRGLTQIRGQSNSFPAVQALIDLAAEVRILLGPDFRLHADDDPPRAAPPSGAGFSLH